MDQQIQIVLTTKDPRYSIPSSPISVPSSINSKELNKLVNDLLKESGRVDVVELCFIINNEFLTSSLGDYLKEKELSVEVITIEFCEKQKAPDYHSSIDQDDLISCVKRMQSFVLTGSYDGTFQIWSLGDDKSLPLLKVELEERIKCVEWLSLDVENTMTGVFVTGGFDQTARLWRWDMKADSATCLAVCRGHSQTVMTATALVPRTTQGCGAPPKLFATGSWDQTIKLWSTSPESADLSEETGGIVHTRKSVDKVPTRIPVLTLAGHRDKVTRICHWPPEDPAVSRSEYQAASSVTPGQLISVGWDHALRLWDYTRAASGESVGNGDEDGTKKRSAGGSELRCVLSSHAFHDADAGVGGVLTASSDNRVRIYDLRANEALAQVGFQGHTAWLTAVAWAPHRPDQFVTGSIDRSVRLWDTRNPKAPLYDLMGHRDIVTDVDWAPPADSWPATIGQGLANDAIGSPVQRQSQSQQRHYILSASGDYSVKVYRYPSAEQS